MPACRLSGAVALSCTMTHDVLTGRAANPKPRQVCTEPLPSRWNHLGLVSTHTLGSAPLQRPVPCNLPGFPGRTARCLCCRAGHGCHLQWPPPVPCVSESPPPSPGSARGVIAAAQGLLGSLGLRSEKGAGCSLHGEYGRAGVGRGIQHL